MGKRRDQLPQDLEDLIQVFIVLAQLRTRLSFQLIEPFLQRRVARRLTSQLDERPHDRDVDSDRAIAPEDPGEHRDSLLGEDVRGVATPAPAVI